MSNYKYYLFSDIEGTTIGPREIAKVFSSRRQFFLLFFLLLLLCVQAICFNPLVNIFFFSSGFLNSDWLYIFKGLLLYLLLNPERESWYICQKESFLGECPFFGGGNLESCQSSSVKNIFFSFTCYRVTKVIALVKRSLSYIFVVFMLQDLRLYIRKLFFLRYYALRDSYLCGEWDRLFEFEFYPGRCIHKYHIF